MISLFYPFYPYLLAQLVKNLPAMQRPWFNSWVRKIHWGRNRLPTPIFLGFPCSSAGKESTCNAGDLGSIPGLGRPPREGKGYLWGASGRTSTHGKGHEEGGSTYAKAGSSLRSPPGNSRASTPITRACLLYYFVLSPTLLTLRGAVPHHLFQRRS